MSEPPRVALVAPVAYYRHAAIALHRAGLLERWLTSPVRARPWPGEGLPGVGSRIARFNRNRVFAEVAELPVRHLWAAQAAARAADAWYASRPEGSAFPLKTRAWDLDARLRLGHPDVLHAMSGVGTSVGRAARRQGGFVVCDVRTVHPERHRATTAPILGRRGLSYRAPNESIRDRMEEEFATADLIIGCSELVRTSFLEAGFAADRVVSVAYGADLTRFHPAPDPPAPFTVLFAGRERLRKGFVDVAEAARALAPTSRLLVTGARDAIADRLLTGVRADVEFLGEVDSSAMPEVFRRASVLVLPSLSEAFGLVVIEALASGVPVIVSTETGAAEAVTDGRNGFVVPPGDPEALADRLRVLERDPDAVAALRGPARTAAEPYSWATYGQRLVGVYRDLITPRLA